MNDTWKRQCYRKIVKWLCFILSVRNGLRQAAKVRFLYGEVEKSHTKPMQRTVRVEKGWSSSEKAPLKPMQEHS